MAIAIGLIFFISSCGGPSEEAATTEEEVATTEEESTNEFESESMSVNKAGKVFYMIPSPLELSSRSCPARR